MRHSAQHGVASGRCTSHQHATTTADRHTEHNNNRTSPSDGSAAHNGGKAQKGFLAMVGNAPVSWTCKVHKCAAYANEKLGTAHPDRSTGAHEVYAAGDAAQSMLHISYVVRELHVPFPSPMTLEMDNT